MAVRMTVSDRRIDRLGLRSLLVALVAIPRVIMIAGTLSELAMPERKRSIAGVMVGSPKAAASARA